MEVQHVAARDKSLQLNDLGPGQVIDESSASELMVVGNLEVKLQIAADGPSVRALVIEIRRGDHFNLWANITKKKRASFSIYVKCYLVFADVPEKCVKLKTAPVVPIVSPEFNAQLIPMMSEDMLKRAQHLRIELWKRNGRLRSNQVVGMSTIDLGHLSLDTRHPVTGVYKLVAAG
ncbi:uncharacterized protein LOC135817151 isoform X1 [Sycon ciliatum]|uniref:uncharacterized protein LOC135817151 isoform X1 n=2 Tax=Sycon ciliatum TaxID=27933 RepID=UPI0031F6C737